MIGLRSSLKCHILLAIGRINKNPLQDRRPENLKCYSICVGHIFHWMHYTSLNFLLKIWINWESDVSWCDLLCTESEHLCATLFSCTVGWAEHWVCEKEERWSGLFPKWPAISWSISSGQYVYIIYIFWG